MLATQTLSVDWSRKDKRDDGQDGVPPSYIFGDLGLCAIPGTTLIGDLLLGEFLLGEFLLGEFLLDEFLFGGLFPLVESPRRVRSLGFVAPDRLAGLNLTVVGLL